MAITKTGYNIWREGGTSESLEELSGQPLVAREGRKCSVCQSQLSALNCDPNDFCASCRSRARSLIAGEKPRPGDPRDAKIFKIIAQDAGRGRTDLYRWRSHEDKDTRS